MCKNALNWGTSFIDKYGATGNLAEGDNDKPLTNDDNGMYTATNKMTVSTLRMTRTSMPPPTTMTKITLRRAASPRVLKMVIALAQMLLAVSATGLSSLSTIRG
jgi:hypothetical protein